MVILGVQDFAGTDALTVKVYYDEDADVSTATADVTKQVPITVIEVNDPPSVSASVDLGGVSEDTPIKVYASALIAKTTDDQTVTVDGTPVLDDPSQGSLSVKATDADGDYWTFAPSQDFNGTVDLSFDVTDGTTSVAATASLTARRLGTGCETCWTFPSPFASWRGC